jgi:hypothetical protein
MRGIAVGASEVLGERVLLGKRGIARVLLVGMSANLCVEAHLREQLEQAVEVTVLSDATESPAPACRTTGGPSVRAQRVWVR